MLHIASAMTAGMASTSLTNPVWVIKTRFMVSTKTINGMCEISLEWLILLLQSQSKRSLHRYNNIFDAFTTIAKNEGIRGFYKGLGPSLIGVSHVAIQFPLYEKLKSLLSEKSMQSDTVNILLASAVSKMVASTATYPHEVKHTQNHAICFIINFFFLIGYSYKITKSVCKTIQI